MTDVNRKPEENASDVAVDEMTETPVPAHLEDAGAQGDEPENSSPMDGADAPDGGNDNPGKDASDGTEEEPETYVCRTTEADGRVSIFL